MTAGMNAVGIIAEYNPFHNGHRYHLERSKAISGAEAALIVMSGDFVQRGEPALLDKWMRAEMAVSQGADLVLELPVLYACNNAEYFARGAVRLLSRLEPVTHLSFGSESGDLSALLALSQLLAEEPADFRSTLQKTAAAGASFPRARAEAVRRICGGEAAELLETPNNVLAVEYLKQLQQCGSRIRPVTVKRYGSGYDTVNPDLQFAGASALRRLLLAGRITEALPYLPAGFARYFEPVEAFGGRAGLQRTARSPNSPNRPNPDLMRAEDFYSLILYAIRRAEPAGLAEIFGATEGLENRLRAAAMNADSFSSLVAESKSKRYTETRIRRLLFQTLLGLTRQAVRQAVRQDLTYARVLALNGTGGRLLRQIKKQTAPLPVLTNLNRCRTEREAVWPVLRYDVLASDLRHLVAFGSMKPGSDFRRHPFVAGPEPGR